MSIKKVELHTHLEGTITPSLAKQLAKRNKISLPTELFTQDEETYQYSDFISFLDTYDQVAAVIKRPEDYYDITFDYLKSCALGNTIYVEMMYSPDHAERSSHISSSHHLEAIQAAIDKANQDYAIVGRIIITAVRHFGVEAAIKVAKQAVKEKLSCIVGFGLGGDEVKFPPRLFKEAYHIAAAGGLSCTVHAGEFSPASRMLEAIAYLPIQRIGHGVQAIHSSETLRQLKEKGITLEICPSSNIALGLFKSLEEHPLPQLLNTGISIALGSDDPPFFRTTIAKEYERIQEAYHYTNAEMSYFTLMALEASFAEEKTKNELKKML